MIFFPFRSIFSAFSLRIPVFCILFFLLYSSVFCFDTFPVFRGITSPLCMIILFFFPCFGSFRFFFILFYICRNTFSSQRHQRNCFSLLSHSQSFIIFEAILYFPSLTRHYNSLYYKQQYSRAEKQPRKTAVGCFPGLSDQYLFIFLLLHGNGF